MLHSCICHSSGNPHFSIVALALLVGECNISRAFSRIEWSDRTVDCHSFLPLPLMKGPSISHYSFRDSFHFAVMVFANIIIMTVLFSKQNLSCQSLSFQFYFNSISSQLNVPMFSISSLIPPYRLLIESLPQFAGESSIHAACCKHTAENQRNHDVI